MLHKPSPLALSIAVVLASLAAETAHAVPVSPIISDAQTSSRTLANQDTLTVTRTGSLVTSGKSLDLKGAATGSGVVIDNSGLLQSSTGRVVDTSGSDSTTRFYQIINREGGRIVGYDDAIRMNNPFSAGSLLIDNAGSITSATGQALDLDKLQSAATTTIINRVSGVIHSDGNDAIRPGGNASITNYGEISSSDMITADTKNDGIDFQGAAGGHVENHGLISGGRHGITTDVGATLINYEDGVIIGRNGSGFGSDGDGTVINYGRISGAYNGLVPDGDGDGVDIDYTGHIENHGIIEGLGAAGSKDGSPNGSEGIAMGGGTIINYAGAVIRSVDRGILVDDGNGNSGFGKTYLENHGTISGEKLSGVTLSGDLDDTVINDGLIQGGNGIALEMGGGNDSLILLSGSRFEGLVDGGTGRDTVTLDDAAGGNFGNSTHFEWLDVKQGSWALSSVNDFSEGGEVFSGASLSNTGSILGTLQVDQGATYSGSGSVGGLNVAGTLIASPALGAAHVTGNLNLQSGSTLSFGVEPSGAHATVQVDGTASIAGSHLAVQAGSGNWPWQSSVQVISATGGVSGQFADVKSNFAFLTPTLSYGANSVDLQLTRNDVQFGDLASSSNGHNAGAALQSQNGGALYNALVTSDAGNATAALEQLAGASNASLAAATISGSQQVGSAMLNAVRQLGSNSLLAATERSDTPMLAATGVPSEARNLNDPNAAGRLWVQGIGSHGKLDEHDKSGDLQQNTGGTLLGADWAVTPDWRLGVLGGYSHTDLDGSGGVSGDIDSWHLGAYALHQSGPLAVRLGAAYSSHDGESKRRVEFDGFSDRPKGDYDADSWQAFVETGYAMGSGRLSAEPYARLDYQRYERDSYDEKGGAAALHVDSQDQDNLSSTLGLRIARLDTLSNGMSFTPRLGLGWRHTFGDIDSQTRQSFLAGGDAFSVQGTALDRNSLLLDVGFDIGVSARNTVGIGYSGQMGSNAQNHALIAQWQMAF